MVKVGWEVARESTADSNVEMSSHIELTAHKEQGLHRAADTSLTVSQRGIRLVPPTDPREA